MKTIKVTYQIYKVCSDIIEVEDEFFLQGVEYGDAWDEICRCNPEISTDYPFDLNFDNISLGLDVVRMEIIDKDGKCEFDTFF